MSPSILFLNVNGSGMGHLNRCLAYARQLRGGARPVFFSLASAIEVIEEMGFEADYFVSHYWSASSSFAWNSELAVRFGLMLERVRPAAVVFDGTWPFQGFMAACKAYGSPAMVWSNRGLLKADASPVTVDENDFDLVIQPGELGAATSESDLQGGGKRVTVPPVCLLERDELMGRLAARTALGLATEERYALFSLGPGNLKDVAGIGHGLIRAFEAQGFRVRWARPPISVRDVELPESVEPLSVYPLARYLRAFDVFVGAAGYNTCCEVVQSGVPTLLVPNEQLADDQLRRARLVAGVTPAVVSACETESERDAAVEELMAMLAREADSSIPLMVRSFDGAQAHHEQAQRNEPELPMNGAAVAADEILALATRRLQ